MPRNVLSQDEVKKYNLENFSTRPKPQIIPGTEKVKDPFSKDQKDAAGFAERMMRANKIMNNLEDDGFDPTNFKESVLIERSPFVPNILENYLFSPQYQLYQQAVRDFALAQLRRESGAAITPQEYEEVALIYMPVPGDGTAVKAQKRKARQAVAEQMKISAGKAYRIKTEETKKSDQAPQEEALDVLLKRSQTDEVLRQKLIDLGYIKQ
ncbi:MAG TPA: hypothetical protein DEB18_03400 [Leeuwenhoekiella sp.]|nr:hypothetical protein [Leeuwenhoekiella sp.]